jgi:WD40 repeat protein
MSGFSISRDGRRAIDSSLTVWDAEAGAVAYKLAEQFPAEQAKLLQGSDVKMTADGSRAVSGGFYNTLTVWDTVNGSMIRQFEEKKIKPHRVDLADDIQRAALQDFYGITILDINSGEARRLEWPEGNLRSAALTCDGRRVVAGTDFRPKVQGFVPPGDSPLLVWDVEGDEAPRRLDGHGGAITAIALSADGRRAVTCGLDCTVIYWNLDEGSPIHRLKGHDKRLWAVALSPDERFALSGGNDCKIVLWDLKTGDAVTWLWFDREITHIDWGGNRIGVMNGNVEFLELQA